MDQVRYLRWTLASRQMFTWFRMMPPEALTDVQRAARLYFLLKNAAPRPYHIDRLKPLLPAFRETPIGRITKGMVQEYRLARHRAKNLSDATINRDIECLRHLLYWAVDEGLLAANPLARLRLERERRKRRSVLSFEEEMAVIANASPLLKKLIVAALHTGMRRGELFSQRWEDVDFPRRLLFVTHSKTPEGESREIPLTTQLFEMLSADQKKDGLIFTYGDSPKVLEGS